MAQLLILVVPSIVGRLYDKTGHLKTWWTDSDTTKFKQKAKCIIDQYSNFTVEGTGGMTVTQYNIF